VDDQRSATQGNAPEGPSDASSPAPIGVPTTDGAGDGAQPHAASDGEESSTEEASAQRLGEPPSQGSLGDADDSDGVAQEPVVAAESSSAPSSSAAPGSATDAADLAGHAPAGPGSSEASAASTREPRQLRRYSWPLRLFIAYYVFDAIVRSLVTLTPFDDAWRKDLKMDRFPTLLPTASEVRKIRQGKDDKYDDVSERYLASLESVVEYASPWPDEDTAKRIEGPNDFGKYVLVWVGTRLSYVGALLGLDQNWPMFSPNVRKSRIVPRAKLVYEDGTAEQLWLLAEPFDLTEFSRWFIKRPLQIDIRLDKDYDSRLGVSRHLARQFPYSAAGSPLRFIEMYKVRYTLPRPGQDAYRVLSKQNRKAPEAEPFWRYDVTTGKGKTFEKKKDKKKKKKKKKADEGEPGAKKDESKPEQSVKTPSEAER